jgi:hypothetical protein
MALVTKQIRKGAHYRHEIYAAGERVSRDRLHCPVLEMLSSIQQPFLDRLTALWEFTARNGPPCNDTKFKAVAGSEGIFEFKVYQTRVFCFWDRNVIICTNGITKKSNRADPQDIKTAESWKTAYFNAKKSDKLIYEDEHYHA